MANPPFLIVAIDGGAASGKSSSARLLADRFDLLHVDTGSFYRHITAELLRRGVPSSDLKALQAALAALQFSTQIEGRSARMLIDGQPAGDEIRSEEVNGTFPTTPPSPRCARNCWATSAASRTSRASTGSAGS
jgi:cytidylate kinase